MTVEIQAPTVAAATNGRNGKGVERLAQPHYTAKPRNVFEEFEQKLERMKREAESAIEEANTVRDEPDWFSCLPEKLDSEAPTHWFWDEPDRDDKPTPEEIEAAWRIALADTPDVETPRLRWAAEAWEPRPEREYLVQGLIGAGDLALLVGDPGVGKTYLLADMAACIADGKPWLGRPVQQRGVLIIDEESGERRLFDRLERTMRGHGISPGTKVPIAFVSLAGFDFRTEESAAVLTDLIYTADAGLVIIDALADVMLGGDENSAKDIQPVFRRLRDVAATTGAACIVIHHTNKAGGFRGSTAITGAIDLGLLVTRADKDSGLLRIETIKARDIEPLTIGARGVWREDLKTFNLESADVKERGEKFTKPELYVLRFLKEAGEAGADMTDIQRHAEKDSTPTTAKKAVWELIKKGFVERIDKGGPGSRGTYALVPGNIVGGAVV